MEHLLSMNPEARVLCAAGFHTGRAKLAAFWDVLPSVGLEIEAIFEVDAYGVKREWVPID